MKELETSRNILMTLKEQEMQEAPKMDALSSDLMLKADMILFPVTYYYYYYYYYYYLDSHHFKFCA